MRFLRMLGNALAAGALASAYVVVLFLELNPSLSLAPSSLVPLVLNIAPFYAASCAVAAFGALIVWHLFGPRAVSPGWMSATLLAWMGSAAAALGASLMWANLGTFSLVLEDQTARALAGGAIIVGVVAVWLLITALVSRYVERRGWLAVWIVALCVASVALPLALRGRGTATPLDSRPLGDLLAVPQSDHSARVTIIALDAGSLEVITSATAQGRLPNFGRILDAGAVAHLATLHPTAAQAVWAAVATGKLPQKNGVRSAAVYRLAGRQEPIPLLPDYCFASALVRMGRLTEERRTSASLHGRTLWTILSAAGVSVGIVNYPLTYPAPQVRGFVVSDAYARIAAHSGDGDANAAVYPTELWPEAEAARRADEGVPLPPEALQIAERHRIAAETDRIYDSVWRALTVDHPAQVSLMRFESPDPIGHYFLRYAIPSRFGDVSDQDRRRYGGVLEAHYAIVDEAIGRAIDGLEPDDLLLVVSPYGMEPLGLGKRALEQLFGDPDVNGTHEAAPDGFLLAYGSSVVRNRQLRRSSVLDVLPTVLYFLGLPVARDMDGYARTDLFSPSFTEERPITFIPTYDR